jgi:hypothetical protein
MRRRPAPWLLVAATLGVLLAGCGGDRTDPVDQPTPVAGDNPTVKEFFTRLASQRTDRLGQALELTAPGSPAHKYVTFQLDLAEARRDDDVRPGRVRVQQRDGGHLLCGPGQRGARCAQFTAIDMVGDRISSFDVDGDTIADNLSVGSGRPQELTSGATVEFRSSYLQPATDSYWVLLRVTAAEEPVQLHLDGARYARVGGEVLEPVLHSRRDRVPPGSAATVALVFPHAEVGGNVDLRLLVGGEEEQVGIATAPYVPETDPG